MQIVQEFGISYRHAARDLRLAFAYAYPQSEKKRRAQNGQIIAWCKKVAAAAFREKDFGGCVAALRLWQIQVAASGGDRQLLEVTIGGHMNAKPALEDFGDCEADVSTYRRSRRADQS